MIVLAYVVAGQIDQMDKTGIVLHHPVEGFPLQGHGHDVSGLSLAAAEAAAGLKAVYEPRAIPAVVFTDPEIAWCGLTETEARERQRLTVRALLRLQARLHDAGMEQADNHLGNYVLSGDTVWLTDAGSVRHGLPLDAGREAGAAAAPQAGLPDRVDHALRSELDRLATGLEALVRAEVIDVERCDQSAAPESPALLVDQVGNLVDRSEAPLVLTAVEEAGREHAGHVVGAGLLALAVPVLGYRWLLRRLRASGAAPVPPSPPSTAMHWPVIMRAVSDDRNSTASTISRG